MDRYFLYLYLFLVPHSVVCNRLNAVKCMPCILYYDTCNLKHIFFCRKMWCVQNAIFWLFCKCHLIHKEVTIQCTIKSPSFLSCNVRLVSLNGPKYHAILAFLEAPLLWNVPSLFGCSLSVRLLWHFQLGSGELNNTSNENKLTRENCFFTIVMSY